MKTFVLTATLSTLAVALRSPIRLKVNGHDKPWIGPDQELSGRSLKMSGVAGWTDSQLPGSEKIYKKR